MAEYIVLDTLDTGSKVYTAGDTVSIDDAALASRLIDLGVIEGDVPEDATAADADLAKLTKVQLLEMASREGVETVSDAMTKADIIAAIEVAVVANAGSE